MSAVAPAQILSDDTTGYVYFIQAGDSGAIKVGWALVPQFRIRELQVGNHQTLRMIATVEGDMKLEKMLQRRLASYHIRGEWFRDSPELRAVISEYHARPTNHQRTHVGDPRNGQQCVNCGALLTEADDKGPPGASDIDWAGHCRACREFAEIRTSGKDPFDDD